MQHAEAAGGKTCIATALEKYHLARGGIFQLNPRGVSYSFTLIVSFHPVFLTAIDRAFSIKCFFTEAVRAIDVALDVRWGCAWGCGSVLSSGG